MSVWRFHQILVLIYKQLFYCVFSSNKPHPHFGNYKKYKTHLKAMMFIFKIHARLKVFFIAVAPLFDVAYGDEEI